MRGGASDDCRPHIWMPSRCVCTQTVLARLVDWWRLWCRSGLRHSRCFCTLGCHGAPGASNYKQDLRQQCSYGGSPRTSDKGIKMFVNLCSKLGLLTVHPLFVGLGRDIRALAEPPSFRSGIADCTKNATFGGPCCVPKTDVFFQPLYLTLVRGFNLQPV